MNKIFKVVWSRVKHCYVVTSEIAKSTGRSKSSVGIATVAAMACVVALTMVGGAAQAAWTLKGPGMPSSGRVVGDGNTVEVQNGTGTTAVLTAGNTSTMKYNINRETVVVDEATGGVTSQTSSNNIAFSTASEVSKAIAASGFTLDVNVIEPDKDNVERAGNTVINPGEKLTITAAGLSNVEYVEDENGAGIRINTNATPITVGSNGKVAYADNDADPDTAGNQAVTAGNVINVINNSGWYTNAVGSNITGSAKKTLIKPGGSVNFEAGDGLKIQQSVNTNTNTVTYRFDATSTGATGGSSENIYFHVNDGTNAGTGNATTNYGAISDAAGATATGAVTGGVNAKGQGLTSVAIGQDSHAVTNESIAIGHNAVAGREDMPGITDPNDRTKVGKNSNIAIGNGAQATGGRNISIGEFAGQDVPDNWNIHNVNIGSEAGTASKKDYSVAIGYQAGALTDATVQAAQAGVADGNRAPSVLLGKEAGKNTASYGNIALGSGAAANISDVRATNNIAIGNGAGSGITSDNGRNTTFPGFNSGANIAIGAAAGQNLSGDGTVAVGNLAGRNSKGDNNILMGHLAGESATSDRSIIMGPQSGIGANVRNDRAILIGNFANGAVGNQTLTTTHVIGIGSSVTVTGDRATAIGRNAYAAGDDSVAMGTSARTTDAANRTVAIGTGIRATTSNSVVLGSSSDGSSAATTETTGSITASDGSTITYGNYVGKPSTAGHYVSVGSSGAERQIKHVAAGKVFADSTDAINGSQLYATNQVVGNVAGSVKNIFGGNATLNPDGNMTFTDIGGTGKNTIHEAIATKISDNSIKLGGDNGTTTDAQNLSKDGGLQFNVVGGDSGKYVTTSAAGSNVTVDLTQDTKDKIDKITTVEETVNKGLRFDANSGGEKTNALGSKVTVQGTGAKADSEYNTSNIKTIISQENGDTTINIGLAKDLTGITSIANNEGGPTISLGDKDVKISNGNLDMDGNKITNVAAGTADTDAVNVSQLKEAIAAGSKTYVSDGKNTTVTGTGTQDDPYRVNVNDQATFGSKDGEDGTNGVDGAIGVTGKDGNAVVIDGSDGSISAIGKDGTGVVINGKDGSVGIAGKDGSSANMTTKDSAVGLDGTDGSSRIVYTDKDGKENEVATMNDGLKFTGNNESTTNKHKLNTLVKVQGERNDGRTSYTASDSAANNIMVEADGTDTLTVKLSKDLQGINTITNGGSSITLNENPANNNGNAVTINGGNLNMGGNKITNVASGTEKTDAATVGQLPQVTSSNDSVRVIESVDENGAKIYDLAVDIINPNVVNELADEIGRVGAQGAALAALKPIQYDPLEPTQIMAGYGNYRGNSALALGVAHYKNESTMIHGGVSWAAGDGRHMMANAGITWKVGNRDSEAAIADRYRKGPISSAYALQNEVAAMKAENTGLKGEVANLKAENQEMKAENQEMKAQIAMLMQRLGL